MVTGELGHQTAAVPRVVHPSPGQIQQGQALAGSYLVTFRPNLGEIDRAHQGFVGFAAEQSAHVAYQTAALLERGRSAPSDGGKTSQSQRQRYAALPQRTDH